MLVNILDELAVIFKPKDRSGSERIGDRMKQIALILFIVWSSALSTTACTAENQAQPNILVVLVDDMRWDDLGCAGHPFSKTPNMNRVAAEGARF